MHCIFISYPWYVNVLNYKPLKVASLWLKWLPFNDDRLMMAWLVFSQLTLQKIFFLWLDEVWYWREVKLMNWIYLQTQFFSWKFSSWIIGKKALIFWMLNQVRHDKLDDKVPRHLRMTIFSNIKRRNMKCLSLFTSHISSPKIYAWLTRNWIMKNIIISSETAAFCLVQSDFLLSWVSKKTSCFILNASFADSFSNKSA